MTDDTTGKQRKTLLGSATRYANDARSHVRNPDLIKLESEIETTLKEAREAAEREQLLTKSTEADKQRREEFREYLQEVTYMARAKDWDIFKPDWDVLKTAPCFPINVLIGLSVGLHHHFSSPNWIFYRAMPYFEGEEWARFPCAPNMPSIESEIDPPQINEERVKLLHEFLIRRKVTINHLQPRGDLVPIVGVHESAEIQPLDFIKLAERLNWDVPAEFRETLSGIKTNKKQQPKIDSQSQQAEQLTRLLKLIFVMAVDCYEYDPSITRNWATGDKEKSINNKISHHIKVSIDNGTVKNCLTKAGIYLGLHTENKTNNPRKEKTLLILIGMAMDGYKHKSTKSVDTANKLTCAITRVNKKLSLNIEIDHDVITDILTTAEKEIPSQATNGAKRNRN